MQLIRVSMIALTFLFCGCEQWQELLWQLAEQHHPAADGGIEPAIVEPALSAVALDGGSIAIPTYAALTFVDVHELTAPRVVSDYRLDGALAAFQVDDRMLIIRHIDRQYLGARSDVPAPREAGLSVLNLDIRDPAHPVVLDEWSLPVDDYIDCRLRRSAAGAELYVLAQRIPNTQSVQWLQLRDGRLSAPASEEVLGGFGSQLDVRIASATTDWLVIQALGTASLQVWRIDSGQPVKQRDASLAGDIYPRPDMQITGGVIHAPYQSGSGSDTRYLVDTFALADDSAAPALGSCELQALLSDDSKISDPLELHFLGPNLFQVGVDHAGSHELRRFLTDAQGSCRAVTAPSGCSSAAPNVYSHFYPLSSELTAAIETTTGSPQTSLSLYGTTVGSCFAPRASIDAGTYLSDLQSSAGLLSLSCTSPVDQRTTSSCVQLVSYSDNTLTPRAMIPVSAQLLSTVFMPGAKLAFATRRDLVTYDVGELDAPKQLGSVRLFGNYRALFGFGDYLARIDWPGFGHNQLEILPLTAAAEHDPVIARVDLGNAEEWQQVDNLLLTIERKIEYGPTASEWLVGLVVQVYDLSDPTQPRVAGRLDLDFPDSGPFVQQYDSGRVIGKALVYTYPDRTNTALLADTIDLRDPDHPAFTSGFALGVGQAQELVAGSTMYENLQLPAAYAFRSVDFADPRAPVLSPEIALPAPIRLALGQDLYVQASGTLSRLRVNGATAEPQAERMLPGYTEALGIESDHAGHLYALYQQVDAPGWATLFVLDDQTLEPLATLPIDNSASDPRYANGLLLIEGPGVSFVVDVREPTSPRLLSYVGFTAKLLGDRVLEYGNSQGYRVFDAAAESVFAYP